MDTYTHKIGIVLINYKHYCDRFLAPARETLEKLNYPRDKYTVYIIDNASTVESFNRLKEMYPEAVVIASQGNGWGHANNIGMKMAWQDGCDAAALVNMDTEFDREWLRELVDAAYSDDTIGIAQAKILLWQQDKTDAKINSVGNLFHYLGFSFCDGYKDEDITTREYESEATRKVPLPLREGAGEGSSNPTQPPLEKGRSTAWIKDIYSASGASLLIKRNVAEYVGGCDEEYFMYHDDLELSLKAKIAGYRIVLAQKSIMYHKYEFGRSVRQIYYMERNRFLTILTFFKWRTIFLITPALMFMDFGMWFYALAGNWFGTKIRTEMYFLKPSTWKHIMKQRKKITSIRTISDKQLLKGVVGKVEFQEIENPALKYIANPILNVYWRIARKLIVW